MRVRTGMIVVIAALMALPRSAWAYARGTHQHLTELGYAYVKLLTEKCAPELIGDAATYNDCISGCIPPEEVLSPAVVSSETNTCFRQCFLDSHRFPDPQCNALAPVFARGIVDRARAAAVTSFYQGVSATPCPPISTSQGQAPYNYYGVDHCVGTGNQRNLTAPPNAPLVNWTEAAKAYERTQPGYLPVVGGLLGSTALTADGTRADLTGTILGLHASVVDKFSDMYTAVQILPIVNDFLKTYAELVAGAAIGYFGVLALYFGACGCAFACPVTLFTGDCGACFDAVGGFANDVFGSIGPTLDAIEEFNILPVAEGPTTFDQDNTSMFHFMTTPFQDLGASGSEYDDIDGFNFPRARGGWQGGITAAHDTYFIDQLFDIKVEYPPSRRALMNYQIVSPDDSMRATDERGVFYWHRYGMANYVFPPVDNLAYYWWHKWLEGRIAGKTSSYGLMPLGGALHAVQDITQPLHARNDLTPRHADYESSIQSRLDPVLASAEADGPLLIDLTDPAQEEAFLTRVSDFVGDLYENIIQAQGDVLQIRQLIHFMYLQSVHAEPDDKYTVEVGIPLAVAATVAVLLEGATNNLDSYAGNLRLSLAEFERKGPVPPIDTSGSPGSDPPPPGLDIPVGFDAAHPEWVCAANNARSFAAAEGYVHGSVTGRQLMVTVLSEKSRCDMQTLGMPVPPQSELDQLASYSVGSYQALSSFLVSGSMPQFQQDAACNAVANLSSALSPSELAVAKMSCAGTLDSDGDGVPDQTDACVTPAAVRGRHPVGANGCSFAHADSPQLLVTPFVAGTIHQRRTP